jgi:hypothetical protein
VVTPIAALAFATVACSKKSPETQIKEITNDLKESASAEAPVPAPKVDQAKITAIVDFLNLMKFNCGPYTQRYSESQDECANVYENFIYKKDSQTLLFLERSGPIGPDMREYSHAIDIKSSKGLVKLEPYFQQPEVTAVTLIATSMCKSIGTVTNPSEGATEEKDLVQFVVDPQNGPRLKKALEDLLKAHNITISEY